MIKYFKGRDNSNKNHSSRRIFEIDFLRGLFIILMCFDHLMFDFSDFLYEISNFRVETASSALLNLFNFASFYWHNDVRAIIRFVIVCLFFVLSGISCSFSRSNLKRGLILLGLGIITSIGTVCISQVLNIEFYVISGLFSTFGISILINTFFIWLFKKIDPKNKFSKYLFFLIAIAPIVIGIMNRTRDGIWLQGFPKNFLEFIGIFTGKGFYGADCIPVFPYCGCLSIGVAIGQIFYKNRESIFSSLNNKIHQKPIRFYDESNTMFTLRRVSYYVSSPFYYTGKFMSKCGEKTVYIYILHQVIYVPIVVIVLLANGYSLNL